MAGGPSVSRHEKSLAGRLAAPGPGTDDENDVTAMYLGDLDAEHVGVDGVEEGAKTSLTDADFFNAFEDDFDVSDMKME